MTPRRMTRCLACSALVVMLLAASCGSDEDDASEVPLDTGAVTDATISDDSSQHFPDVLAAESGQAADGSWTFSVTLSSPYDTAEQYADAWRVLGPDGTEFGYRGLTHDHANEQPFTRSQNGIVIHDDIDTVTVQGRDLINGWGGDTLDHELAR